MKEMANQLREKVMEKVQTAQKQVHGLEEDVQKFVSTVQDKLVSNSADGIRKVDELLKTVAVKDFIERIRGVEMVKQGQEFGKDLLNRFGIVSTADMSSVKEELTGLKQTISSLEKKMSTLSQRPSAPRTSKKSVR